MPSIRLQRDILEILEIITSLNTFDYPFIKSEQTKEDVFQASMNLSIKWEGFSSVEKNIENKKYKTLRFINALKFKGQGNCIMYSVNTNVEGLTGFFLVYPEILKELNMEMKGFKTDLFNKIDNILKGIEKKGIYEEVSFPAFNFAVEWEMPWMQGFEVPKQEEEDSDSYVSNSYEKISVSMGFPANAPGLPIYNDINLIKDDFVFGLRHKDIEETLELPLFVCLVRKNDWIEC
jgi:hypothetical protein